MITLTPVENASQVFPGMYRFDPLEYEDAGMTPTIARETALADRNKVMKMTKKSRPDLVAVGWSLPAQLRKYRALGRPCGRVRTVYYLTVSMAENM